MLEPQIRRGVWVAVLLSLAVLVFAVVVFRGPQRPSELPSESPGVELPIDPADSVVSAEPEKNRPPNSPSRPTTPAVQQPVPYIEGLVYGDIDLREARALLPDNLYWQFGAPTKDPAVLAEREAEKKRRNQEYGRVLAGDANESEVRAYYDHQVRLSSDYLEFSEFMQRRYKDHDSDEFVGMLQLAMKLHAERLAKIPEELEDALTRAREREKVRQDWQRQKEEFGDPALPDNVDQ